MGTVAFQTVFGAREKMKRESRGESDAAAATVGDKPAKRPGLIDTCHALAADSEVVKQLWPEFYVERR